MVHCSIPKDYLLLNFIPHSNLNSPISFFRSKKLRYAVTKVLAKDVLAPSKLLLLQLHWLLCISTIFWELCAPESKYFLTVSMLFLLFNLFTYLLSPEKRHKGWKEENKSENNKERILTSFWVPIAPNSWLKYTATGI